MATIEFLQKRVAGKEKEIEKLEKKLARIHEAEATGWTKNPYYYSESDLRWTVRDLDAARKALEDYRADLTVAEQKAGSRNVPAILEFLKQWKERCTLFYGTGLKAFFDEKEAVYQLYRAYGEEFYGSDAYKAKRAAYEAAQDAFYCKVHGYYEEYEYERFGRKYKYKGKTKVRDGEYEHLRSYTSERTLDEAMAKLAKDLNDEADRKYDFIIERTNTVVGTITDAAGLTVGDKGDLNGFIKGDAGTAKVQTIGAGGWNVQCFHFRTLINKV
jgi:hypothetical protein